MTSKREHNRNSLKPMLTDLLQVFVSTALLLCIPFRHFFSNPFYYFAADISEAYYPWWVFLNRAVRSSSLPLLNRFWYAGSLPFAALETGVFYPPYLLAQSFFDAHHSLDIAYFFQFGMEIFHYSLASIGFYLLMKIGLELGRSASLFGALAYSCSGSFMGRFVHPVVINTLAWLPWLYIFYLLFVRRRSLVYALATSVVLAVIVVSGHPQLVYYTFVIFGMTVLYISFVLTKRDKDLVLALSICIVLVSLLLVAYKVLLTVELANQIVHTVSETSIRNLYNSLHPLYYLTLLVPYLFGKHGTGYWGSEYPWGNWENFLYIGVLPICCLPLFVRWQNKRLIGLFAMGLGVTVFLSFGRYNAASAFVNQHLPLAENLSMISKITVFSHFFLVALATIGLHLALTAKVNRNLLAGFLLYSLTLIVILFTIHADRVGRIQPANRPPPSAEATRFAASSLVQARFLLAASGTLVVLMLLGNRKRVLGFLLPLYAVDLLLTTGDFNPIDGSAGRPSEHFKESQIIRRIHQDHSLHRVANLWPPNINMVQSVEATNGYHTVETKAYHRVSGFIDPRNRSLLDLLNVKYFISDQDLEQFGFLPVQPRLWRNPTVMQRVHFVPSYKSCATREEMAEGLTAPSFDPRREVLLYRSTPFSHGFAGRSLQHDIRWRARYRITEYRASSLKVDVDSTVPGFLALSELQYPGWRARIDGRESDLLPANLSFYALPIEAGHHRVEFFFQSKPLLFGAIAASITLALLLLPLSLRRARRYYIMPFNEW